MAWVNIEQNNNVYTYQLDLSKLANHGDACVIGGRYIDNSNSFSYLYGKWGFDMEPSGLRSDYWTMYREHYSDFLLVVEDLSVQNTPGVAMNFSDGWNYGTEWFTDPIIHDDTNSGSLSCPTFILNDNGIIRIIKDEKTLQNFLSGYFPEEN